MVGYMQLKIFSSRQQDDKEAGATLLEFGVGLALIAIIVLVGVSDFGVTTNKLVCDSFGQDGLNLRPGEYIHWDAAAQKCAAGGGTIFTPCTNPSGCGTVL